MVPDTLIFSIFNICGLIGGAASLLDRVIQGENYVPYIGTWTAAILFVISGFGSTSLLDSKDRSGGTLAMFVMTLAVFAALVGVLHGSMSR